ncbi:hypothetical protein C1H46_012640 [Malus baccata]|uniref:Uncharacterized protein n=1 Tax=Malus baccata TaxID=106549 RepID=A0A540MSB9_MALBA|nr:hypothetical protein C1H46_012640 [Malus baccata]
MTSNSEPSLSLHHLSLVLGDEADVGVKERDEVGDLDDIVLGGDAAEEDAVDDRGPVLESVEHQLYVGILCDLDDIKLRTVVAVAPPISRFFSSTNIPIISTSRWSNTTIVSGMRFEVDHHALCS